MILADDREKATVDDINDFAIPIEWTHLEYGDYACRKGCCGFERKEGDFSNYKQVLLQVEELKLAYPNAYLIINIDPSEFLSYSPQYPQRIGFLASLAVRGVFPICVPEYTFMLHLIHTIVQKHHDSKERSLKHLHRVRRYSNREMALHVLMSFPDVGIVTAKRLLMEYGSVGNFVLSEKEAWTNVEGVGDKTADALSATIWKEVQPHELTK